MTPRTWTLTIIAPCAWLTANIERNRYQRSDKVRQWREATVAACMVERLPKGISPVRLSATVLHPKGKAPVRDRLNLAPTIKAIVDALTPSRTFTRAGKTYVTAGYGFLPDDSDKHVRATDWALHPMRPESQFPAPLGAVLLTIEEVA